MQYSLKQLEDALLAYGPHAPEKAKSVRRILLGRQSIEETALMDLLQGLRDAADSEGHYAEIIEATGAEVNASTHLTFHRVSLCSQSPAPLYSLHHRLVRVHSS